MLSRAANNLFWMARLIERAENMARLVDVNTQFLLDANLNPDAPAAAGWQPILAATSLEDAFREQHDAEPKLNAADFLALSPDNPESIRECIAQARENARMVRDQISEEMWRELNRLHLFLKSPSAEDEWSFSSQEFCERIIQFSLLFHGITDATIEHGEEWLFIRLGKFLERADKTTRILDIPSHLGPLLPVAPWPTVLRACSARSSFLANFGATISREKTLSLLLFSHSFPRSVRFCLNQVDDALHRISSTPRGGFANEAERLAGATLAAVDFNGSSDLEAMGIHEYADRLQKQLNDIGQQIFETYVLLPSYLEESPQSGYAMMSRQSQSQQ
ncbi:MAG: alpha-E domain-containing protein [Akkermansiaceae bacterium]|nr:alpha-E domain-containing protein [Akkermansiaceae bacterium]